MLCLGLVVGALAGWAITWLHAQARAAASVARQAADKEKIEWIKDSQANLREAFQALASRALRENAEDFSGRVKNQLGAHAQHIGVLKQALEKNVGQLDGSIRQLESKREGAYRQLSQQVADLGEAHKTLVQTTQRLLEALRSGPVRGRWGEIQLRKIVELAGMTEHVSFSEQVVGILGGKPDAVVHLPNEGRIPVDSKFPLQAFLEAMEATDEKTRVGKLYVHARTLREKIKELSKKGYWKEFDPAPELTIMFVPIESCLMVAYEHDPEIIEFALQHKIILASPVTLLGYMKSIAYGWQQFTISKNARRILASGKELHSRIEVWMDHFRKTGLRIAAAAKSYNDTIGSLQSRFLPACRRFQELTAIVEDIQDVEPITDGINLLPLRDPPLGGPADDDAGAGECGVR
jgi:DNA recombination protein RmuC